MGRLFLFHHLGLGDHLICNGIYRELSQRHKKIYFIVKWHNYKSVTRMLSDCGNIRIFPAPKSFADVLQRKLQKIIIFLNLGTLGLGFYGKDFFIPGDNLRLDENFYKQAQVPFEKRWSEFKFKRDSNKEKEILKYFKIENQKYIFIHEDSGRGFKINREKFSTDLKVISPTPLAGFNFFDYALLIEGAEEIHCIESSFAALIEGLQISNKKFAHRYARPEARNDRRHEFTYRSNWIVI